MDAMRLLCCDERTLSESSLDGGESRKRDAALESEISDAIANPCHATTSTNLERGNVHYISRSAPPLAGQSASSTTATSAHNTILGRTCIHPYPSFVAAC